MSNNSTESIFEVSSTTMSSTKLEKFYFNLVTAVILTVFCLIGNSIVLFVLTKPKFLEVPLFRYLIVATIVETISVLFIWASGFPNIFGINNYDINCKMYVYTSLVFLEFGPWINVLSSIDRYLSVKHENKYNFRNKLKYQAIAISIIFLLIILIDVPYFENGMVINNACDSTPGYPVYMIFILLINMHCILPSLSMIIMDGMTIYQLIVRRKKFNKTKFDKEVQLAKFLFSNNLVFIILNSPFAIYLGVQYFIGVNFFITFGYRVVVVLQKIDYSCIFIVYYFSNKLFRKEVQSIFGIKNRVEPIRVAPLQVTHRVNTERKIMNNKQRFNKEMNMLPIQMKRNNFM